MKEENPLLISNEQLIKETSENFSLLQEKYKKDKEECIPFIGAGLSKPTGIDGWSDLLISMAEEFNLYDDEIKEKLKKSSYLQVASDLYNKIGNHTEYTKFLNQQFIQSVNLTTSTIIKIVYLFKSIITTNYDTAIEEAHKTIEFVKTGNSTINYEIQAFPKFKTTSFIKKSTIAYLHGHISNKIYLLTQEDYESSYPTILKKNEPSKLEDFLKANIQENSLIFFGFSFDDKFFYDFFKHVINESNREKEKNRQFEQYSDSEQIEHFAFIKLKKDDKKKNIIDNNSLHQKLKEINVKAIYYENTYVELESEYLDQIKTETVSNEEGAYAYAK